MLVLVTLLLTGLMATGCQGFDDKFNDLFGRLDKHDRDISDLNRRVTSLEEMVKTLNAQMAQVLPLVDVLEKADFITGFTENPDGSYILTFSHHDPIVVRNGEDGKDGKDGNTPLFRINAETNSWEVSYDNGATYESTGVKATGYDGVTPMIQINPDTN